MLYKILEEFIISIIIVKSSVRDNMLLIAIIIGLLTVASGIAVITMFGEFFLNWLNTIPDMPDFINSDSFFAWVLLTIGFLTLSYIFRKVYLLSMKGIIKLTVMAEEWLHERANVPQRTFAGASGGFIVSSVVLFVLTILGLLYGVNYLYDTAATYNPQLTEIYDPEEHNGFVKFVHYAYFVGLLLPSYKIKLLNKTD